MAILATWHHPVCDRITNWFGVWVFLALCAAGCGSPQNALIVFPVEVASEVPDFQQYRFSVVDEPRFPVRHVDEEGRRPTFRLGYYLPDARGTLRILGEALRSDGCAVGEGITAATSVEPGKTSYAEKLTVVSLPVARCERGDGAVDLAPDRGATDSIADLVTDSAVVSDGDAGTDREAPDVTADRALDDASTGDGDGPGCPMGESICGDSCVDLNTDPDHCGRCDHGCLGGSCESGVCRPVLVAVEDGDIALTSDRINLFSTSERLSYVPIAGDSSAMPRTLATFTGSGCSSLTADAVTPDIYLYCAFAASPYFKRIPPEGGDGTNLPPDPESVGPPFFASGRSVLYLTDTLDLTGTRFSILRRIVPDGSIVGDLRMFPYDPPTTIASLIGVDGTSVFVRSTDGLTPEIWQVDVASGIAIRLYSGPDEPSRAVSDGVNVYFTLAGGLFGLSKGAEASEVTPVHADAEATPWVAVDERSVYYGAASGNCSSYRIMRLSKSGGAAESVVEGQNRCLLSLFVNETAVVWQAEIPSLDFEHPDPCIDTATCTSVFKLAK